MKLLKLLSSLTLVAALSVPGGLIAMQAPAQKTAAPSKSTPAAAPSTSEIADAKSKGMVWVNTSTKVYHKDGAFYGATKHGKFMTEDDAVKAGYRAAKTPGSKAKAPAAK